MEKDLKMCLEPMELPQYYFFPNESFGRKTSKQYSSEKQYMMVNDMCQSDWAEGGQRIGSICLGKYEGISRRD